MTDPNVSVDFGKRGRPTEVRVRFGAVTPDVLDAVNVILADRPLSGTTVMGVPMREGASFDRCDFGWTAAHTAETPAP